MLKLNLARAKYAIKGLPGVNRFMALGMPEKTALAFATCLNNAAKRQGCTAEQSVELNKLAAQIIAKGAASEIDVRQIIDVCPALGTAMINHHGYGTYRALVRNAANGGFTSVKFIEVVMTRFRKA